MSSVPRNKTKSQPRKKQEAKSVGPAGLFMWALAAAFSVWMLLAVFFGRTRGKIGDALIPALFFCFGSAAYVLPFLLLYGLAALLINIKKESKGTLTLGAGVFLVLISVSSFIERMSEWWGHWQSASAGGAVGRALDGFFSSMFGGFGSVLLSFVLLFLGLNILFRIPWASLLKFFFAKLKDDYSSWTVARQELRAGLDRISEKERGRQKIYDAEPVPEAVIPDDVKTDCARKTEKETPIPNKKEYQPPVIVRTKENETKENVPEAGQIKKKNEEEIKNRPSPAKQEPSSDPYFKDFRLPDTSLLDVQTAQTNIPGPDEGELQRASRLLEETLKNFNIEVHVKGVYPGPVVTRYEVKLGTGVKISQVESLANDVAMAMKSAGAVRVTLIPGKDVLGFEIPNTRRETVSFRALLESSEFKKAKTPLSVALGRYTEGAVALSDLEKMPHLLIAGATASGKSVFMQSLILSIMFRNRPDEVKFLFIDPKRLELTFYEGIPYLYDPNAMPDQVAVVTEAKKAAMSLAAMVTVMYKRNQKFQKAQVKNLESYNKWAAENGEQPEYRIVVVVDELADLMQQERKSIEQSIQSLAQMARAVGIHLILATQRPSTDVITGVIKANLPSRVALKVASSTDSRVILDSTGAEALLGRGDMLFLGPGSPKPFRIQGAWVSEREIQRVADFVRRQAGPSYEPLYCEEDAGAVSGKGSSSAEIIKALKVISSRGRVSQDLLKAHFGSSARATNILSILEMEGYISKPEGTNRWSIDMPKVQAELKAAEGADIPEEEEEDEEAEENFSRNE